MAKITKLTATEDQANVVMDILGAAENRENGYNPGSRTYTLLKKDITDLKKAGFSANKFVLDANGLTLKLDINKLEAILLKPSDAESEDETAATKPKKKGASKKKGKKSTKDKKKSTTKKKAAPAKEEVEESPLPEPEKALSDKNPLVLEPGGDFLIWVGYYPYPRIADYIEEATEHGFLKKAVRIPDGFEAGDTRIFLAHNEGFDGLGVIIGYCKPEIKNGKIGEYPKRRDGQEMSDANATYLTGEFIAFDKFINIKDVPKTKRYLPVNGEAIMSAKKFTSSPSSRAGVSQKLDTEIKRAKSRWTEEDRKALAKHVKANDNPNKFREFAIATGRTVRSVEYQWYGPMKKLKMH